MIRIASLIMARTVPGLIAANADRVRAPSDDIDRRVTMDGAEKPSVTMRVVTRMKNDLEKKIV
jgi:hypothetical protein